MRISLATLVALIATLVCTIPGQTAWSQEGDPFAADPFSSGPPKAKRQTQSPPATPTSVPKPVEVGRAARMKLNGLDPVKVAVVSEYDSEKRIVNSLDDETTNTFIETPLSEAIQMISRTHNIPIVVDRRALEDVGLTGDTPVNLALKDVSLRAFLRLMLREFELTYMIKDQVMQITTIEVAKQNLRTKMYRLPDNLAEKADEVLKVLQSAIAPDTWNEQQGRSTANAIDHVLIISTTSDVHDEVEDFLNALIESHEE